MAWDDPALLPNRISPSLTTTGTLGCSKSLNLITALVSKEATPHPSSSQLIPVPPSSRLKVLIPNLSLSCQVRDTSALPAAGWAALFPTEVPAKQDESDTPVGFLARLWAPSYIGKPKPHGAAGWGWHNHPCADASQGVRRGEAVLERLGQAGWVHGTRGAADRVVPRSQQGAQQQSRW